MEKKLHIQETLKEKYKARHKDRIYTFILDGGKFRGKILHTTRLVQEMKANHETGVLETLALGQAYMGALILSSNLKDEGRIQLNIECGGPIKGLSVEADTHGTVRGYLKENPIPLDKAPESLDLSPYFGPGFLSVNRLEGKMRTPHTSQVMLQYGNISKDLASYYLESEQIPTLFNLAVKLGTKGEVVSSGALFIQVMPGTEESEIEQLEMDVENLPSLGDRLAQGVTPAQYLQTHFADLNPEILEDKAVEFFCQCSKDYYKPYLKGLEKKDKKEIAENGPFPLQLKCFNCNTTHEFSQEEIQNIMDF